MFTTTQAECWSWCLVLCRVTGTLLSAVGTATRCWTSTVPAEQWYICTHHVHVHVHDTHIMCTCIYIFISNYRKSWLRHAVTKVHFRITTAPSVSCESECSVIFLFHCLLVYVHFMYLVMFVCFVVINSLPPPFHPPPLFLPLSLRCCTSHITRLPSCTHPLTQNANYEEHEFCPSSPQASLQDLVSNSTVGPLDSYTPYVDEVLLRLSHDVTAPVFTRRVIGGFVLQHRRDPPYSVCGCNDTQSVCSNFFGSLQPCGNDSVRPVYVAPLPDLFPIQSGSCPSLKYSSGSSEVGNRSESGEDGCGSDGSGSHSGDDESGEGGSADHVEGGCESLNFQPGYEVDGLGADFLNAGVCDREGVGRCGCEGGEGRMMSALYYPGTEETLSVTVWYNNRVSVTVWKGCVKSCSLQTVNGGLEV